MTKFILLPEEDLADKTARLRAFMAEENIDAVFVDDNANKYYLTGRVFSGYILLTQNYIKWFIRRPAHFKGDDLHVIRKVENISETVDVTELRTIAFELDLSSYNNIERYKKVFRASEVKNADRLLMRCRSVKTSYEIKLIELSSDKLSEVYRKVPSMFRPGMTDVELQIEIERASRLEGCLGIFRINGNEMELNMGSVLVGNNSDNASPYDFAMGGAGTDPSLPVGADGTVIKPGNTVMVDTNGNFTGYMTDMTRTFVCSKVDEEITKAHNLSIEICNHLANIGKPGTAASYLYEEACRMAREAGLESRFMGHNSQAGFVGHGVGIVINELPVLAPRSKDILQEGNVIAVEPKFVMEGAGAVGVENTYVVTKEGMKRLTLAPQQLIEL